MPEKLTMTKEEIEFSPEKEEKTKDLLEHIAEMKDNLQRTINSYQRGKSLTLFHCKVSDHYQKDLEFLNYHDRKDPKIKKMIRKYFIFFDSIVKRIFGEIYNCEKEFEINKSGILGEFAIKKAFRRCGTQVFKEIPEEINLKRDTTIDKETLDKDYKIDLIVKITPKLYMFIQNKVLNKANRLHMFGGSNTKELFNKIPKEMRSSAYIKENYIDKIFNFINENIIKKDDTRFAPILIFFPELIQYEKSQTYIQDKKKEQIEAITGKRKKRNYPKFIHYFDEFGEPTEEMMYWFKAYGLKK